MDTAAGPARGMTSLRHVGPHCCPEKTQGSSELIKELVSAVPQSCVHENPRCQITPKKKAAKAGGGAKTAAGLPVFQP
jgi:hypothetical protein